MFSLTPSVPRFCTYSNANVYVTTFNVNGQEPPDYLGNWLALDMKNPPDLIAIGYVLRADGYSEMCFQPSRNGSDFGHLCDRQRDQAGTMAISSGAGFAESV